MRDEVHEDMAAIPQPVMLAVVVLGLFALVVARLPLFRRDFRRSVSIAVGAVSLLTIVLSLNVLITALSLQEAAPPEQFALINGLLLAGLVLLLVSTLAFFFSLGVMIWTLVPSDNLSSRTEPPANASPSLQPFEPNTR